MAFPSAVDSSQELLNAQSHVWNLTFSFINSMCLKSALQLGIPDAIHKHNKPITLSELADALSITKSKSHALFRLMRVLVHSKIFDKVKTGEEEEAYALTGTSRLLLRDEPLSFAHFALTTTDRVAVDTYHCMTEWFRDECPTPFETKYGRDVWEFGADDGKWNQLFNKGMTRDSELVGSIFVRECKHVFEGLEIVVDVAGGSGALAKAITAAFPGLRCVVLDLPQVVDGLQGSENVSFVSGDMFKFVPPADAVILKWILHDWSDEDCLKILEKCKEATVGGSGKVIILDMVVDCEKQEHKAIETQLFFDMAMMVGHGGKERTEKEWANLFSKAGFQNYNITPLLGLRSVIEVFP